MSDLIDMQMTSAEIEQRLEDHKKWLSDEGGKRAGLGGADLRRADLGGANLSGVDGLTDPSDYVMEQFEVVDDGVIAYKTFGLHYEPPGHWDIEEGSVLEEVVNPCRTSRCGSGVNVATKGWVEPAELDIWKCLLRWEDMASVVVPYNADGKIRAGRVVLLERL